MSITWKISQLYLNTSDGFVTTAHWKVTAVDGDHSASSYATASWPEGTITVPYSDLTESTVLGWVWESVDKSATESYLADQIDLINNPVKASGTPW